MKQYIILIALITLLASCSSSGEYIAYDSQVLSSPVGVKYDYDGSKKLASDLKGKVLTVRFETNYALVSGLLPKEVILTRSIEHPDEYTTEKFTDGRKLILQLRKEQDYLSLSIVNKLDTDLSNNTNIQVGLKLQKK